jgi:hypothetical protein
MKTLSLITLILVTLLLATQCFAGSGSVAITLSGTAGGAGGGPDAYYYGAGADTYANNATLQDTEPCGDTVTITTGGSLTKVGVKATNSGDPCAYKVMLYNSSGTLLQSKTTSRTSSDNNAWVDTTLDTPQTVANGATVTVVAHNATACFDILYNGGSGGHYESGIAYATDPRASITVNTAGPECAVRVYVD